MTSDISRILNKLGPSDEALYYWGLWQEINPSQFAVIKISGDCIEKNESLEKIAEDLTDLSRLGLVPIITHGWGKVLTDKLREKGIESRFVDGDRYTDSAVMKEVGIVAMETAHKLYKAVVGKGASAKIIDYKSKVLVGKGKEDSRYGECNGDIIFINKIPIFEAILEKSIPIIPPIAVSEDGDKLYNINAATAGAKFVEVIDPAKYIIITSTKGILDKNGKTINEIVLKGDYERLKDGSVVAGGMLKNLEEAKYTLETRKDGEDKSAQIVDAGDILYELFTKKGAGTFIRTGYTIFKKLVRDMDSSELKSSTEIIENAFQQKLVGDYFTEMAEKNAEVYMERNEKGIATVIPRPIGEHGKYLGLPYLDIFAVRTAYQRNGVGKDIFSAILKDDGKLFWRSRKDRTIKDFYLDVCSGHQEFKIGSQWYNGYWIGINAQEESQVIANMINYMQQKPSNFKQD